MNRIARLLRPVPRHNLSATVSAVLAAVLPALALAGAMAGGQAHAVAGDSAVRPTQKAAADFSTCAKPKWPPASLAANETGTVTLAFRVDAGGNITESKVRKSSGHPALDEAAREGIAKCHFKPARKDGKPVASWMGMQYVWMLK